MSNNKKILSLSDWANEFSLTVSQEIYSVLDGIEKDKRGSLHTRLPIEFLSRFICLTVYQTLKEVPEDLKSNKDKYEYSLKAFQTVKAGIAEAVAQGFTAAMNQYSGKDCDYLCTIKLLADAPSKTVN